MAKRTAKKAPLLSADRVRTGWQGPAGTLIRLARSQDAGAADALLATSGDGVQFLPELRAAIEDGSAASTMLAGLDGLKAYRRAASVAFTSQPMTEALTTVCLTLVATDDQDRTIGALSATAPGTLIDMAMKNGFSPDRAMALSLFVGKVHGLAVAEHARGQGIAAVLLKRTWQVYQQLGYYVVYGSYEADRDLGAFYSRRGWAVHAPGESFSLDPIALPFRLGAGADQCMFTRWRPHR
ncbi:GNAT family N-acetyltransferase [Streptomyces lunaelactis]|uniref:GNAT family N-acetyltransferase n=1 Tax=Streptomyces lunaelactis TaxID=1535768 RepID=UPI001584B3BF|nr:GNAT family N-acetyltransferase [Streptomyces lunaelactis]NUK21681.1 GNAT family N-acetyltransferase [Streptomyces lunaelactis]